MRHPLIEKILSEIRPEEKEFVNFYSEILMAVEQQIENKGIRIIDVKKDTELYNWLKHKFDWSLPSIITLQHELGISLIKKGDSLN